jgi:hypothetical protein
MTDRNELMLLAEGAVKGSTVCIDSIFRFMDDSDMFPAFLQIAKKNGCKVRFINEEVEIDPSDKDSFCGVVVAAFKVYLDMEKQFGGKRNNFEKNLSGKKIFVGVDTSQEAILK